MKMIDYECPRCGEPMHSPESLRGGTEFCPGCRKAVEVPNETVDDDDFGDGESIADEEDNMGSEPASTGSPMDSDPRLANSNVLLVNHATRERAKTTYGYWLRWVAVLPGGLIAGVIAVFLLHLILYVTIVYHGPLLGVIEMPAGDKIALADTLERALYPFAIAISFVVSGCEIAPRHKFKTAIVLAVLYETLAIGVLILISAYYGLQVSLEARSVGPTIGLLLGLFIVWHRAKRVMCAHRNEAEPDAEHETNRIFGITVLVAFAKAVPVLALAIGGLWYAAAGSITWLRWVLGCLGALSASRGLSWVPLLALYSSSLTNAEEPDEERDANRRLGVNAMVAFVQAAPVVAFAIWSIWYAAAGSVTWLRWVLGVVGTLSAIKAMFWLPNLAFALYIAFLLLGKLPWWLWAVSSIPVAILHIVLDLPLWALFLMLFSAELLLACFWAEAGRLGTKPKPR